MRRVSSHGPQDEIFLRNPLAYRVLSKCILRGAHTQTHLNAFERILRMQPNDPHKPWVFEGCAQNSSWDQGLGVIYHAMRRNRANRTWIFTTVLAARTGDRVK